MLSVAADSIGDSISRPRAPSAAELSHDKLGRGEMRGAGGRRPGRVLSLTCAPYVECLVEPREDFRGHALPEVRQELPCAHITRRQPLRLNACGAAVGNFVSAQRQVGIGKDPRNLLQNTCAPRVATSARQVGGTADHLQHTLRHPHTAPWSQRRRGHSSVLARLCRTCKNLSNTSYVSSCVGSNVPPHAAIVMPGMPLPNDEWPGMSISGNTRTPRSVA